MSVVAMKRVMIVALKKDRKKILETLQRRGVMEITGGMEDEIFRHQDTGNARSIFTKNSELADQALKILDKHAPESKGILSSFEGRVPISVEEYNQRISSRDRIVDECRSIVGLEKEYSDKKAEIPKRETELFSLSPWLSFDLPINYPGTKTTSAFIGTLPGEQSEEMIRAAVSETAGDCPAQIEIISTMQEQTCVFLLCKKENEEAVKEALRRMNFAKPPIESGVPSREKERLEKEIALLNNDVAYLEKAIAAKGPEREDIRFARDYFSMRAEKYEILESLLQSDSVFILNGYVPEEEVPALKEELTGKFDLVFEVSDPEEGEDVPVLLKNNAFAAPVESVVESYSEPGVRERDPSTLVAVFYYILFGIMLGDAGYGLIMMGFCGFALKKYPNMEPGMRRMMQMLFYCGISTTIMGVLFGSFFGDAVSVIASTFFGRDDIAFKPLWFEPLHQPMKMMVISFVIGIVHLFVGLGAKLYADIKDGHTLDGIYDVVSWYCLVGGAVLLLLTSETMTGMLGLSFTLPGAFSVIAKILMIAGAVLIVAMSGRESKNVAKRTAKGLYNLYGATSYLSDILSYTRLLALGLAATVISSVFNLMAGMVAKGRGVVGVILFIIIFLIGHLMNFAINALGAYVHTNRLTYVEFFGKFYEGGGRKFKPFSVNTQYFKVKEDN